MHPIGDLRPLGVLFRAAQLGRMNGAEVPTAAWSKKRRREMED